MNDMNDMFEILYQMLRTNRKNPDRPLRKFTYFAQLMAIRCSMFTWSIPGTDPDAEMWIERYLACSGSILAGKQDDKIVIAPYPDRVGDLNEYGDGVDGYGVPQGGYPEIMGRIGKTVGICYNNTARSADLDLIYYPDTLAAIDQSIMDIVENCRIAPIIGTDNSVTTTAIQGILKSLRNGEPQVITSENVLKSISAAVGARPGIYSVHLVDPDYTHNAQYLAELWDVMLRRFCNMIGIDTRKTTKHAQVTADEATGLDAVSWVLPLDMLRCRQRFCETMKNITGEQWSVRFSDAWKMEFEKYNAETEQAIADVNETRAAAGDLNGGEQNDGETGTAG